MGGSGTLPLGPLALSSDVASRVILRTVASCGTLRAAVLPVSVRAGGQAVSIMEAQMPQDRSAL